MIKHPSRLHLIGACALAGTSTGVSAGGFALIEQGASGLGHSYAGSAAVAADPSTIWFNPAGMSELDTREISIAGHVLVTDAEWTDRGTTLANELGGAEASGPDDANPGTTAFLPNLYYSAPIGERWHYGLGIGVPFGSSTEYDRDWKGRYTTVKSGVSVFDINPAFSYEVNDAVRLGFGVSLQYLTAELGSAVDSGAVCLGRLADPGPCADAGLLPGVQANDGYGKISGDSTGFGFNLGALFVPRDGTRIGLAYRHGVSHELDGDADFDTNPALRELLDAAGDSILSDTGAKAEIDLPATFAISAAQRVGDKLDLLFDLTWYQWSDFQELRIEYDNADQPDTLSIQAYDDVYRVSAGVKYDLNPKLQLRGGVAYDEEAIPGPRQRTARIPGNDRTWISFGAGYAVSSKLSFDVGYAHLFLNETAIDNRNLEATGGEIVRGTFDSQVNIFSAQLNWHFD